MKKIVLILFTLFLSLNIYAQRRQNMNRIPQSNKEPTEQEIAKREREIEERKEEYIDNFLTTLEADEFQKHIIKQTISSFFDAKLVLLQTRFDRSFEREDAIKQLEISHFKDLKELISESDMEKVTEMAKGEFNEKQALKKKKKQRKKNRRSKD